MSALALEGRPSLDSLTGAARDAAAALGARARFCDLYDELGSAVYHDITLADDTELREVLSLLRSTPPGPVLELAAGAGRMTLPLVASGRHVWALDLSASLLEILDERARTLVRPARERLHITAGDMADFHLDTRFDLIVLASTSITLLSPQQRLGLYRCVRDHLTPHGRFLVTVPVPSAATSEVTDIRRTVTGWSGQEYDMYDTLTPGGGHRTVTVITRQDGPVPVAVSHPRLFDGRVVGAELAAQGFTCTEEIPLGDCTERLDELIQVWTVPA